MTYQRFPSVLYSAVFLLLAIVATPAVDASGHMVAMAASAEACVETVCAESEVRLVGRITSLPDDAIFLQTETKGQSEGPSYRLRFADDPLDTETRDLLHQAVLNKTPLTVVGCFVDDEVFLVTAVVSSGRSGVSIGSQ